MAKKKTQPVRLERGALLSALEKWNPGAPQLDDLRAILELGASQDDPQETELKVRQVARLLQLCLLPQAKLIKSRSGKPRSRKPDADRQAQWWRTLDLIWEAIRIEEDRRLSLRSSEEWTREKINRTMGEHPAAGELLDVEQAIGADPDPPRQRERADRRLAPKSKPRRRKREREHGIQGEKLLPLNFGENEETED